LEQMLKQGFFRKSTFMKAGKTFRPHNWFYDDARKYPQIIFGEDYICDHWNKRFSEEHSHVFSFVSKDKNFYTHPRDVWIEGQVALMKKHRLDYCEGFKAMEREYQKKTYVSQLQRQHQLQHIQELGGCSDLSDKTWLDQFMQDEMEIRTKTADELQVRYLKNHLRELVNERLEEANELANQEPGTREQHDEYEEENEYADDPDYQAVQRENPFVNPLRKISVTDFHPSTIDQKMVIQFILENPEVAPCFDMTWFVFDKNMLFHLYSHDKALFYEWLGELKLMEAKWDRVELIKREYWIRLRQARVEEDLEDLESRVIPNHPNQFPRFLWEEETRNLRSKDKEFADLLSTAGNKDAQKWYQSRTESKQKAKDKIAQMMEDMKMKTSDTRIETEKQ